VIPLSQFQQRALVGIAGVAFLVAALFMINDLSVSQGNKQDVGEERRDMIHARPSSRPVSFIPPVEASEPEHTETATFALG
jgi:hypothetical protein